MRAEGQLCLCLVDQERQKRLTIHLDTLVDDGEHTIPSPRFCPFLSPLQSTALQPTEEQPPASLRETDVVSLLTPARGFF